MKKTFLTPAALGALILGLSACSEPASESAQKAESTENMSSMPADSAAAGRVQSTGVVASVDQMGGTVTIAHEAINAINWPAMNMQFKAEDPSILEGIAPGDRVSFELKSTAETGMITGIRKQ